MYQKMGIVSGLGAAAGARMLSCLIKSCQQKGAVRDSDFPEIILHSIQSEGLDNHGIADDAAFRMELLTSVQMLNRCGVELIMIACNTAHVHHAELQDASRAEILNMVDIATEDMDNKVVGVASSATTRETGLYAESLFKRSARIVMVSDAQQKTLDSIIGKVLAGKNGEKERQQLHDIIYSLRREGAEEVILGCTELPLVMLERCIDPVEKTIERALSL